MVASYTSTFEFVFYSGNEGTLVLTEDRLSFYPRAAHKKKLHWNWSVVKSHQVEYFAYRPTWSISVTVRGTILETMKFELESKDAATKLQNEAYKRSGFGTITPTIPVAPLSPTNTPPAAVAGNPPISPRRHQSAHIEALKHQIFDPKSTEKPKSNKDLDTLESVHVSDLRKKLGAMLPAPPPTPKGEPKKEDPFQTLLKDARRSLNSSIQDFNFDVSDHDNSKNDAVNTIDPNQQMLLMAKLNLHHQSQTRSKATQERPSSAFQTYQSDDEPTLMRQSADTSNAVRPKPMSMQELKSADQALQLKTSSTTKRGKIAAPSDWVSELQAELAKTKNTGPTSDSQKILQKDRRSTDNNNLPLVAPQNLEELSNLNRGSSSTASASNVNTGLSGTQQGQQPMPDESLRGGVSTSSSSEEGGVLVTSLTAPPGGWTVSEDEASSSDASMYGQMMAARAALRPPSPPPEEFPKRQVKDEEDAEGLPTSPPPEQNTGLVIKLLVLSVCIVVVGAVVLVLVLDFAISSNDDNKDGTDSSLAPSSYPTLTMTTSIPTGSPGISTSSPDALSPSALQGPTALESPTTGPSPTAPLTPTATVAPQAMSSLPTSSPVSTSAPSLRTSQPTQLPTGSLQASTTDAPIVLGRPTLAPMTLVDFPDFTQPALENPESPQSLARDWLLGDPNLSTYDDWRQLQRFALGTFFYSFNGEEWPFLIRETWMEYEGSECTWFSDAHSILVTIENGSAQLTTTMEANASACNEDGRYTSLEVYKGNAFGTPFHDEFVSAFVGTMPPEVSLLTSLERLAIHTDANIFGISMGDLLPTPFKELTNMTELDLSDSFLKDWDFDALLNLPAVEILDVSNSDFEGTMTTELGLMTGLTQLDVSNSYDNGNQMIPSEIGLLTGLTHLSLASNELTGIFPPEFASLRDLKYLQMSFSKMESFPPTALTNLETLDMSSSEFEGTLPVEIAFYTTLRLLDLSNNRLEGSLPAEIGLLTALETLNLFRNSLTSSLPLEIGLATSLKVIDFEANLLTGIIPSAVMALPDLQQLILRSNALTGYLTPDIGGLKSLEALVLGDNTLSQTIPAEVGLLTSLFIFDLETNFFTGSFPLVDLALVNDLYYLDASSNNLTGTIGTEVGMMTDLTFLNFKDNDLTGSIVTEVGLMKGLQFVDFSRNRIAGPIPTEIGMLSRELSELRLDWNLVSAAIPSEVGLLTSLTAFTARGYTLLGPIPEEVGGMKNLEVLQLGGNPIIGSLPTTMGLLSSLEHLSLNLTTITGTVPSELGLLSSLVYLYLNGTDMTGSVPTEVCSLPLQVLAVDCAAVACDCGCDCFG